MAVYDPWKMVGQFEDGAEIVVGGVSEESCVEALCSLTEKHGDLTWHSGVCDEDYANGEYVGRNNFIYD